MTMPVNHQTYVRLLEEDIDWLMKQPRSLERDHIEIILRRLVSEKEEPVVEDRNPYLVQEERRQQQATKCSFCGGLLIPGPLGSYCPNNCWAKQFGGSITIPTM